MRDYGSNTLYLVGSHLNALRMTKTKQNAFIHNNTNIILQHKYIYFGSIHCSSIILLHKTF